MGKLINKAYENVPNVSLLDHKINFLEYCCEKVLEQNVEGDVAEAGVYKGGSARLLASAFFPKTVYLFDSFQGMLEDDLATDGFHKTGDFSDVSFEAVKSYLKDWSNCKFYKGWFPATADFLTNEVFCFVHLDMDYYQSTKHGLEIFWPKIARNGILVLDDWQWHHCPGVKRAADEYFQNNNEFIKIEASDKNSCAFIKQ